MKSVITIFLGAIVIIAVLVMVLAFTGGDKDPGTEPGTKDLALVRSTPLSPTELATMNPTNCPKEFKFANTATKDLEIWIGTISSEPLVYLTTIPKSSIVFVYPYVEKYLVPGVTFFSKYVGDPEGTYAYQPYMLKDSDHNLYFGEASTDFLRTTSVHSPGNEILSLYIENRSLKPYNVFYLGTCLGQIGPFCAGNKLDYSILTNNDSKFFQLGTWLEFRHERTEESQYIQLMDKFVTDIYLGGVVGRTKDNA